MSSKELIRKFRKEKGFTQIELAEKAGMAVNTLRLYEGGRRHPSEKQLQRLADALNISVSELMESKEDLSDDDSYAYPSIKEVRMYPTDAHTVIFCMVEHDDTVYILTNYPWVPVAEVMPFRLSKKDADDIEVMVMAYHSKHNGERLPPEIGAGILKALDLLKRKSMQAAKQSENAAETSE